MVKYLRKVKVFGGKCSACRCFFKILLSLILRAVPRGVFPVVMRSVAGYVTNGNRERERKEGRKGLNKNLKEENLN